MMNKVYSFIKDEEGQGMTEYGLILGVIAIGAVTAFGVFGDELVKKIDAVRTSIFGTTTTN